MFPGLGPQEAGIILLILIIITFHLAMVVHVLRRKNIALMWRLLWTVAIIFIPIIGAVVYRLTSYRQQA